MTFESIVFMFQFVFILIAAPIVCGEHHQRLPTIEYISQGQFKDIDGTVELLCVVKYLGENSVSWIKKNSQNGIPISFSSNLLVHEPRFSISHDKERSIYRLQIKDIQEIDNGTYICQASTSSNDAVVAAEVELTVRTPPVISDSSTGYVIVSEGEPVDLECYATGYPVPKISWRRENNAVLSTGGSIYRESTLKIKNVRKEDRGTYYCIADNHVGRGTRRDVNVKVAFAPVVTIAHPRVAQTLQNDVDMECGIEAYPKPEITWLKNGIALSPNQHYSITISGTADELTVTVLRIRTIEKEQYGNYTCKAVNKLGSGEGDVELYEPVNPASENSTESITETTTTAVNFTTL